MYQLQPLCSKAPSFNTLRSAVRTAAEWIPQTVTPLAVTGSLESIAPTPSLPNEIWELIFVSHVRDTWETDPTERTPGKMGWTTTVYLSRAWTLSWVCRRWKAVAIGNAEIWSLIRLHCTSLQQDQVLRAHIDRARHFPITLRLSKCSADRFQSSVVYRRLLPLSHRIIHFHVEQFGDPRVVDWTVPVFVDKLDSLITLELDDTDKGAGDTFVSCQKLLSVSLRRFKGWNAVASFQLPWSQLTFLSVGVEGQRGKDGFAEFLEILHQAQELRELWIDVSDRGSHSIEGLVLPSPVRLQHLNRLVIRTEEHKEEAWLPKIIDSVILPQLDSITFRLSYSTLKQDHKLPSSLSALLERSGCQIETMCLDLGTDEGAWDLLRRLVAVTPSIKTLQLHFHLAHWASYGLTALQDCIAFLTWNHATEGQNVAPLLRSLTVRDMRQKGRVRVPPLEAGNLGCAVIKMLQSRASSPLKSLRLDLRDGKQVTGVFPSPEMELAHSLETVFSTEQRQHLLEFEAMWGLICSVANTEPCHENPLWCQGYTPF